MPSSRHPLPASVIFLVCCFCSCAPIRTFVTDPVNTLRARRQDIISSNQLSPLSGQAVRMAGLDEKEALKNGVDEAERQKFEKLASTIDAAYIESELAIGRAQLLEKDSPEKAMALFLYAARLSLFSMLSDSCSNSFDLRCDNFKVFYARSVLGVINFLKNREWQYGDLPRFSAAGAVFQLSISRDPTVEDPKVYSSIAVSATIGLEGLTNRHHRYGAGLALTACRDRRADRDIDRYLPKAGACLPLTAMITFSNHTAGEPIEAHLQLHNSISSNSLVMDEKPVPLAADFTAPFASMIERTGLGAWDGLFSALSGNEELLNHTGFYTLEPYSSGKIPLITVHGLFSNPLAWMGVHNDLMGDPIIREHYQVWHYLYPTNLPILENAKTFRLKLDELHDYLKSREGKEPPGMVIVSHSMGGILTKTAVVKDSEAMRDFFFGNGEEAEKLPKNVQEQLDQYISFSRRPYVERVVFIAVPHRGSIIADNWIGAIGRWFMSLPKSVAGKTQILLRQTRNALRPERRTDFDKTDMTSIKALSPKNPVLISLSKIPVDEHVPFHSIIGDQGKGDTPNSSDGVVAYSSSHLDGAQSELIVPADHTAQADPRAVQEIRRILRLHQNGPHSPQP